MRHKIQIEYTFNPKTIAYIIDEETNTRFWKPTSKEEMLDYLNILYTDEVFEDHDEIDFSDLDENDQELIAGLVWNEFKNILRIK